MSKKKNVMDVRRQGDVWILTCLEPKAAELAQAVEQEPDAHGRIVLAEGETTEHVHVLRQPKGVVLRMPDGRVLLKAKDLIKLLDEPTHPGRPSGRTPHDPIEIPAGFYEIVRQREYAPEAPRPSAD